MLTEITSRFRYKAITAYSQLLRIVACGHRDSVESDAVITDDHLSGRSPGQADLAEADAEPRQLPSSEERQLEGSVPSQVALRQESALGSDATSHSPECERPASLETLDSMQKQFGSSDTSRMGTSSNGTHLQGYHLYRDCLRYLQDTFSPAMLTCSVAGECKPGGRKLADLPAAFGNLVNTLCDILVPPASDLPSALGNPLVVMAIVARALSVPVSSPTFSPIVLATAYKLAEKMERSQSSVAEGGSSCVHGLCVARATMAGTCPTSDLYHALFLDWITDLWHVECCWRVIWSVASPMPWSRKTLEELRTMQAVPPDMTYDVPLVDERALEDDNHPSVRMWRQRYVALMDIPWLGGRHDGYPFSASLSSYTTIRRSKGSIHSLPDDAALWLSAMTLGLLEAITRTQIPVSLLLVPGERAGTSFLSATRILRLLIYWTARIQQDVSGEAFLQHGRDVVALLRRALDAMDEEYIALTGMLPRGGLSEEEAEDIYGPVALLITLIAVLPSHCDELKPWKALPELSVLNNHTAANSYGKFSTTVRRIGLRRMRGNGWCPYTVMGLFSNRSLVFCLSEVMQTPPFIRDSSAEHARCDTEHCVLYSIADTDAYVARHTAPSCHCPNVKPPLAEVLRLLSQDAVPVVTYDADGLHVVPAREGSYVAISHVWAEGMGSTTEEGLPMCVLERIAGLTRTLLPEHDGAFWMDSLCVPSVRDERKRAIRLMGRTYRDSAKVLVIDDCIRSQCSQLNSWDENLIRVATSAWIRRVWTLQEGLLARELYFEFSDGPVNLEQERRPSGPTQINSLVPIFINRTNRVAGDPHRETPLSEVIDLLKGRKTTRAEDELLAIATLLPRQVKLEVLLAEDDGPDLPQRRIRSFLMQLRNVPKAVPFARTPRLSIPGFTWAPQMLVTEYSDSWSTKHGTGRCTKEGLVANYCLLALQTPVTFSRDVFFVRHRSTGFVDMVARDSSASPPSEMAPSTIHALLFMNEEEYNVLGSHQPQLYCVAVTDLENPATPSGYDGRQSPSEPQGSAGTRGTSRRAPRAVKYVSNCVIRRLTQDVGRTDGRDLPGESQSCDILEEPANVWVRLS